MACYTALSVQDVCCIYEQVAAGRLGCGADLKLDAADIANKR